MWTAECKIVVFRSAKETLFRPAVAGWGRVERCPGVPNRGAGSISAETEDTIRLEMSAFRRAITKRRRIAIDTVACQVFRKG